MLMQATPNMEPSNQGKGMCTHVAMLPPMSAQTTVAMNGRG
jgi:hypothetical protein